MIDAATTYGRPFGYTLAHDEPNRTVRLDITQPVLGVTYVYPCRLGTVTGAGADGVPVPVTGADVRLPPGTRHAEIRYRVPSRQPQN